MYSVKIQFDIKKDGNNFHTTTLEYDNLKYEYMYELEKLGVKLIEELLSWGKPEVPQTVTK